MEIDGAEQFHCAGRSKAASPPIQVVQIGRDALRERTFAVGDSS